MGITLWQQRLVQWTVQPFTHIVLFFYKYIFEWLILNWTLDSYFRAEQNVTFYKINIVFNNRMCQQIFSPWESSATDNFFFLNGPLGGSQCKLHIVMFLLQYVVQFFLSSGQESVLVYTMFKHVIICAICYVTIINAAVKHTDHFSLKPTKYSLASLCRETQISVSKCKNNAIFDFIL